MCVQSLPDMRLPIACYQGVIHLVSHVKHVKNVLAKSNFVPVIVDQDNQQENLQTDCILKFLVKDIKIQHLRTSRLKFSLTTILSLAEERDIMLNIHGKY